MQLGARVRQAIRLSLLLSYPSVTPRLRQHSELPGSGQKWKPIEKEAVGFLG